MPNPYRALLQTPGAVAFSTAGFVARMPISMVGIGIVLLVESATGSYGIAGAVAATFALVQALASPVVAALIDRVGQARVCVPLLVAHALGIGALLAGAEFDAPVVALFAAAALAGAATPAIGSLVRARWAHALGGTPALQTAYSLESVLDELIFIIGPVLVTVLATSVSRLAGLGTALALAVIGVLALAVQRGSEPPAHGGRVAPGSGVLRNPGLRVLVAVYIAVGTIFGSVEVVTVAFADERGSQSRAALVLAAFALGSMLSGIAYGARAAGHTTPLPVRFVRTSVTLGLAVMVLPLVGSLPVLAAVVFIAGFAISPALISGFGLVELLVPSQRLTEGLTWISTGIGIGLAVGSSAAGRVVDVAGAQRAFLVTTVAGALVAVGALAGRQTFRPDPAAQSGRLVDAG